MKVEKEIDVPASKGVRLEFIQCELCGAKTERKRTWPFKLSDKAKQPLYRDFEVNKVKAMLCEGSTYPDSGKPRKTIVDMCPTCFKEKFLLWVHSLGGKERVEDGT